MKATTSATTPLSATKCWPISCLEGLKKVCLLTATPRNRGALDVYNQIKLFHQDDITQLPIDPPNLKEYFKLDRERAKSGSRTCWSTS